MRGSLAFKIVQPDWKPPHLQIQLYTEKLVSKTIKRYPKFLASSNG